MDRAFVTAVEGIYETATAPSLWPEALQRVADVFDDVAANLLWKRDDGRFGVILSSGFDPNSATEYNEKWWQNDIRALRSPEQLYLNPGRALTDRHMVTPLEMETHPIYTDFLARYGLRWVAGTFISPDAHTFVSINVQRALGRPPFSDDELGVLAKLGVHAEKSLHLSIRLMDSELAQVGLGEALNRLTIGVFVIDSRSRVGFVNSAGMRLLGDGLKIENHRLRITGNGKQLAGDAQLASILSGEFNATAEPQPMLVHNNHSERPLILYVLPIRPSGRATDQILTQARAVVLVIVPKSDEPPDPSLVRDVLGLTLGEAKVASLVGSGLGPRASAERLGISEETARTVLKRVFSKTGLSRQSELVGLLTKVALR